MKHLLYIARFCIIPALGFGFCLFGTNLQAGQPFQYSVENNEITITGCPGKVTELLIPEKIDGMPVTKIGSGAFYRRPDLKSVSIPKGIKAIESRAFMHCFGLVRISLSEGLETIGEAAFEFYSPLPSVKIPASVRQIEGVPFNGCRALKAIEVSSENQYFSSKDGVLFDKQQTAIIKYPQGKPTSSFLLSSSVVEVQPLALAGCIQLKAIITAEDNPIFSSSRGVLLSKDGKTLLQYPGGLSGPAVIPQNVT
ncbi:MAG: leucine-rich repeat domain-containing protein, partial [Chthoniobacterales bacterium]